MDRESAKRNIGGGLVIGAIAAAMFALAFLAAMFYIAP
jgi:hypothetical protein